MIIVLSPFHNYFSVIVKTSPMVSCSSTYNWGNKVLTHFLKSTIHFLPVSISSPVQPAAVHNKIISIIFVQRKYKASWLLAFSKLKIMSKHISRTITMVKWESVLTRFCPLCLCEGNIIEHVNCHQLLVSLIIAGKSEAAAKNLIL